MNKKYNSILAFDFGTKNIGVAISYTFTKIVHPLTSIKLHHKSINWYKIALLIKEWKPNLIIVGLPLNMDGSEQNFTVKSRKFANILKNKFNICVQLHDERLSTFIARDILFNQGGYRFLKKKKKKKK